MAQGQQGFPGGKELMKRANANKSKGLDGEPGKSFGPKTSSKKIVKKTGKTKK